MKIEEKSIYDEMASYVGNVPHDGFTGELDPWNKALKNWVNVPDPLYYDSGKRINSDGSYIIGDMSLLDRDPSELEETHLQCDREEPKEWSNVSFENWQKTNRKNVNLSLYVVNAVKRHIVGSIDELN